MKRFSLVFAFFFCFLGFTGLLGQAPPIQWQVDFGAFYAEEATAMFQTTDGGYFVGGYSSTEAISCNKTETNEGSTDYWVLKLDALGNIQWQNVIGGDDSDRLSTAQQTADGGYILGGRSASNVSGDKTQPAVYDPINSGNSLDYWLVKLDANGNVMWDRTYGGDGDDRLIRLQQTPDGGYILGGTSKSTLSGVKTENSMGEADFWVIKVDSNGNIQWQNTIGGSADDNLWSIDQTSDGGYILGGESFSGASGDKSEPNMGVNNDYWVVKIDANGTIQWENTIGGIWEDRLKWIEQTADGGYIACGSSRSPAGADRTEPSQGFEDYWILKLDATGNIQWQKAIGGSGSDFAEVIHELPNGGFILGGDSGSNVSGHKTEPSFHFMWAQSGRDYWVLRLDATGNILWQRTLGGTNGEWLHAFAQTADGGYIVAGGTTSTPSGNKTVPMCYPGNNDMWIVKLGPECAYANAGPDMLVCNPSTVLNGAESWAANALYVWEQAPFGTPFNASILPDTTLALPPGNYSFRLTVTNTVLGCSDTDTVAIAVGLPPVALAGGDTSGCPVGPFTLSAGGSLGASVYSWDPAPYGSPFPTSASSDTAVALGPGSHLFYLIAQDGTYGCRDTDTVAITVHLPPTANAGSDFLVCDTELALLNAAGSTSGGGIIYAWDETPFGSPFPSSASPDTSVLLSVGSHSFRLAVINSLTGCSDFDTVTVTISPLPPAPAAAGTTICAGQQAALTATGAGGSLEWYGAATGGSPLATGGSFTTPALGATTTYYVEEVSAVGCTSATRTPVVVAVAPLPAAPSVPGAAICAGQQASLNAAGSGGTVQWYDSPTGGSLLGTGPGYVTPALTANATYYAEEISAAGCTSATRTAVAVTVAPLPPTPTASGATLCGPGLSASLSAAGTGGSLAWYSVPTGGTSLGVGSPFATAPLAASSNFYVEEISAAGCTSATRAVVAVTVAPVPPAPAVSGVAVCFGQPASLAAAGAGGVISWYTVPAGGVAVATGPGFTTPALTATATYYAEEVSAAGCTSATRTAVTVAVEPLPPVPVAPPVPGICSGQTATLGATGAGGTLNWFGVPSGGVPLASGSSYTTPALTSSTTYYIEEVSVAGCKSASRAAVTVSVEPLPPAPSTTGAQLCGAGQSATLSAAGSGGGLVWYTAPTGGVAVATGATYQTPNLAATTSYYIEAVSANGCISATRAVATVTVAPLPSVPAVSGEAVCENQAATLTATSGGGTLAWYSTATGGVAQGTGAIFTTPTLTANTVYYVEEISAAGCTSATRGVAVVTVNPVPAAPTAAGASVCAGQAASLSATGAGGTVMWYDAPQGGNLLQSGLGFTTPNLAATATYYLAEVSAAGCTSATRNAVTVTVDALIEVEGQASSVCAGQGATLVATKPAPALGYTFRWFDSPTSAIPVFEGEQFVSPPLTANTAYYLEALGPGCLAPRIPVLVALLPTPAADFQVPDTLSVNARFTPLNLSSNALSTQWDMGDGTTFSTPAPQHSYNTPGDYRIVLQVANGNCTDSVGYTVSVVGGFLSVPTAFSPNGDGSNDVFVFAQSGFKSLRLRIYDRWGKLVFDNEAATSPLWDGTFQGQACPEGVYVYTVDAVSNSGQQVSRDGTITLLR